MAGQLALRAPHLDGTEPIKVWFAAAWAVYVDLLTSGIDLAALDTAMDALTEPGDGQPGGGPGPDPATGPTMQTWGADPAAQQGQADLMAALGGLGAMGDGP